MCVQNATDVGCRPLRRKKRLWTFLFEDHWFRAIVGILQNVTTNLNTTTTLEFFRGFRSLSERRQLLYLVSRKIFSGELLRNTLSYALLLLISLVTFLPRSACYIMKDIATVVRIQIWVPRRASGLISGGGGKPLMAMFVLRAGNTPCNKCVIALEPFCFNG
jgi:hypothetical protein